MSDAAAGDEGRVALEDFRYRAEAEIGQVMLERREERACGVHIAVRPEVRLDEPVNTPV